MTKENHTEIEVDISDEEFLWLARRAHEEDITLNELVNNIMKEHLDLLEKQETDDGTSND